MNPNLRHQVHYGTLQVHGNAAATMNNNLQYGNAQSATFFPTNMSGGKVYNQQASVMVNNQGFVAMNMDGFDGGQGQRIVGMQGTMAAQMQGAISMTANISPQFNSPGGHNFNMANATMMPGSMMPAPGNIMQTSPGNIMQAPANMMQAPGSVMQASGNMVQGPGNMMHFYKGMNSGMINSPNGLPGMNFSPQSSNVLPSFNQLFGNPSPQFQAPNQQQVHQGGVMNAGNSGGFDNFVQNVVVNGPAQHIHQMQPQQQQQQQQHSVGTFVNIGYNQRQNLNTNTVNASQFTCMPYKQGDNVYMMTTPNLNNKFSTSMPIGTVGRPDCRFSGPGVGTNSGNINLLGCQTSNLAEHAHLRPVSQSAAMVTTTVYSHASVTCSTAVSGQHGQCIMQRPVQSNCGHNHHPSERTSQCAVVSRPSSSFCNNVQTSMSQCRTNFSPGTSKPVTTTTVSLGSVASPVSADSGVVASTTSSPMTDIASPTTTATPTITSTTVSSQPPVSSTVTVPFGWKRVVEGEAVVYYSPSDTRLLSGDCVRKYLQSDGTCKCGLECPLMIDKVFNFDTHIKSKAWTVAEVSCNDDLTKFCNHKRKIIALATLQNSQSMQVPISCQEEKDTGNDKEETANQGSTPVVSSPSKPAKKEGKSKKKKGNKNKGGSGPYDGVLVSQLLAQRDKNRASATRSSLHVPLSKELSSLIDAALGNTDSQNSSKQSEAKGNSKDGDLAKVKCETPSSPNTILRPSSGQQTLSLPALKQAMNRSNTPKQKEKRDPMDDLGPITCHVPGKLDFSLTRPPPNCQHLFSRSPNMMSPALPNNPCLPSNPSHNNPLSIQTTFGPEHFKNQRIFLQSPPCNTGSSAPCDVPMQVPNYGIGDQMATGFGVDRGNIMMQPVHQLQDSMLNVPNPAVQRFPNPAFNQNAQQGNPYHCAPPQHAYMPLNNLRNNLGAPWLDQSKPKPKRIRPKAKKNERRKFRESTSPCPNIDVRNMNMPQESVMGKQATQVTMASFMDNPTAFLAQQTALVHNSMASSSQGVQAASRGLVDCINKSALSSPPLSASRGEAGEHGSVGDSLKQESNFDLTLKTATEESQAFCKSESTPCSPNGSPVAGSRSPVTNTCTSVPLCSGNNIKSDFVAEDNVPSTETESSNPESCPKTQTSSVPSEEPIKKSPKLESQPEPAKRLVKDVHDAKNPGSAAAENLPKPKKSQTPVSEVESPGKQDKGKSKTCLKIREPNSIKQALKKSSSSFPASTLLSAAARAQLASQIQTQVNSKVYQKSSTANTSFSSSVSPISSAPLNAQCNTGRPANSVSYVNSKQTFDNSGFNMLHNSNLSPMISQTCLPGGCSKPLNGLSGILGGMSPAYSHFPAEDGKEQSHIQMVQNVVASIDGKSDTFKTNNVTPGMTAMLPDGVCANKDKELNPLVYDVNYEMNKLGGTLQDPGNKAALQHAINQAFLQQGITNLGASPLGGQVPLMGVNSTMSNGQLSVPVVTTLAPSNNLSQMIPAMGLTQPVIAQQPLMQLISTLNLNNPMLLSTPSVNSPNQTTLSTPQMLGVSVPRSQSSMTSAPSMESNLDTLAQAAVSVCNNNMAVQNCSPGQTSQDPNYVANSLKGSADVKVSPNSVVDGMGQTSAASPAQVVLLPQMQMPLVQMMGSNQMQINSSCMEKSNINNINLNLNMTQMVVPGQAPSPQNLGMFSPPLANNTLNLFNLQQMMNLCSTTNVTAAQLQQLQCLQLQQQLLQQVQYMQSLINQLGLQGVVNNSVASDVQQDKTVQQEEEPSAVVPEDGGLQAGEEFKETEEEEYVGQETKSTEGHEESSVQTDQDVEDVEEGDEGCVSKEIADTSAENLSSKPDSLPLSIKEESRVKDTGELSHVNGNTSGDSEDVTKASCYENVSEAKAETPHQSEVNSGSFHSELSQNDLSDKSEHLPDDISKAENNETEMAEKMPEVNLDSSEESVVKQSPVRETSSEDVPVVEQTHITVPKGTDEKKPESNHIDHTYDGESFEIDRTLQCQQKDTDRTKQTINALESLSPTHLSITNSESLEIHDENEHDDGRLTSSETDSLCDDQGLEVCDGPTAGKTFRRNTNGPVHGEDYRMEDTSSHDGLSSSEDEKIDEIFANHHHRGLKRIYDDYNDSAIDDDDSLDFGDKTMGVFPRNFNVGDLVWGQIRGFPSWPGKLVDENQVKGNPKTEDGKLWVKWFGDHTCTQVEPDKLKTLSEGLEAHHRARKKFRKGRKMNSNLESAIQEAMMELDRPTENLEPPVQANRYVKGRVVKKRRTR